MKQCKLQILALMLITAIFMVPSLALATVYYPDYNETDQGVTGSGQSVKAYEVVVISNRSNKSPLMYAWHADGKTVKGWPIVLRTTPGYPVSSIPVLRDLDGDGRLETIVGDSCYSLHAWYDDGTRVKGFPIGKIGMQTKSPAIADLDNNGHLEIVFGDSSSVLSVHVLELPFFVKKD